MSEQPTPSTPERCFIKPISEHPRDKSDRSDRLEKHGTHSEHQPRSERSNSVRSSSSKHSSIKDDIEHKLSEVQKPEQVVVEVPVSTIQKYLDLQSQFFSEYISIDLVRQFNYQEFLAWRHNAVMMNENHKHLAPEDIVIIEKYVMESLIQSEFTVLDLNEKAYLAYKMNTLPYFVFLPTYLQQCQAQGLDVSYFGYEYFAQLTRERAYEVEMLRQQVIGSSEVSYSEEYFNEFVQLPDSKLDLEHYSNFFEQKEEEEKEEVKKYKETMEGLKKEIKDLNLFVYDSFMQGCYEQGVQPSLQGYQQHLKEMKEEFAEQYLQEKHEQLDADIHEMESPNKLQKVSQKLDEQEMEFLQEEEPVPNEETKTGEPDELQIQRLILGSKDCECCHGKPLDCEGQACALLGQCVCQANY